MFEHLKKYRVVLVTGPHRSGTTICARMIAADTGHDFVIEEEIGFSNLKMLSAFVHARHEPIVIQCPALTHIIDDLKYLIDLDYDDVMVVMMHRYRKDIIDSERRAPANFAAMGAKQKRAYRAEMDRRHISDLKYQYWESQCRCITNALDVGYESLREHPMWIEDRSNMKFQHAVSRGRMTQVMKNGVHAIQHNQA